nr:DUF2752 domain-containing protein [uncultured Flavobacterium sp.]
MNRNKLYIFLLIIIGLGYGWLIYSNIIQTAKPIGCLFKKVTTYPCPSCGTTRAVAQLFQGNFYQALVLNPFGIIMGLAMLVIPIWIVIDFSKKSSSFFVFYKATERYISKKPMAVFLILVVLLNWYWNIKKNL